MKYILTIALFFSFSSIQTQDKINYSSFGIHDSLKKNANAVYVLQEVILDVASASHYTLKVHEVINIMNAEGAHHLNHAHNIGKFYEIDKVEITVYNSLGTSSKKYNKRDFQVTAAYDGISLITDEKIMHLKTPAPEYPCTVDVEYLYKVKSYVDLPDGYYNNHNTSIGTFRYVVQIPNELDIRYKTINCRIEPKVEQLEKKKKYIWEAQNIPATKYQDGGYSFSHYLPRIKVAPNAFEYDGYSGKFTNWADYGQWIYQFYQETNPFSNARIEEIKKMVAGKEDVKEKVEILYSYLQKNFRYVSIQLGIGGLKPFAVKFVDDKKYGDCKALSNYMRYMLQVVGVNSYPALINSGYNSPAADPYFPSDPFDHVILCVPNKTDSIWLECTSNETEAGFLGSFTENKNALLITENGGILVKTPVSKQEKNQMNSFTQITLKEDGGADSKVNISATGDALSIFQWMKKQAKDDQMEAFVNYLHYTAPDDFVVKESNDPEMENQVNFKLTFEKLYSFKAGNKYFFPQKLNKLVAQLLKDETRTAEYVFKFPFQKNDTTIYLLPNNFIANELPASKDLQNEFASYKKQVEYNKDNKQLMIITSFGIKQHIIPAKSYKKLVDLFKEVQQDELEKLVLVAQ